MPKDTICTIIFYKRIQCSTFVAVAFENQFDRLVSYLVTASKEYEEEEEVEEEYEENERLMSLLSWKWPVCSNPSESLCL